MNRKEGKIERWEKMRDERIIYQRERSLWQSKRSSSHCVFIFRTRSRRIPVVLWSRRARDWANLWDIQIQFYFTSNIDLMKLGLAICSSDTFEGNLRTEHWIIYDTLPYWEEEWDRVTLSPNQQSSWIANPSDYRSRLISMATNESAWSSLEMDSHNEEQDRTIVYRHPCTW